ncbi:hypothetical protein GCM10023175_27480 [Pseudonocardia xishanensis]|uniref:Uncharacterized protein n=1 Tax=Pseudonocardia xishanensis TaxID=630995 RepID=A0ABP8RSN1_9PSEU
MPDRVGQQAPVEVGRVRGLRRHDGTLDGLGVLRVHRTRLSPIDAASHELPDRRADSTRPRHRGRSERDTLERVCENCRWVELVFGP